MPVIVDARGLACPEPVLRVKKALETASEIEAIVDNETALENVRRMARASGCSEHFEKKQDGSFHIFIAKTSCASESTATKSSSVSGPTIVSLSSDVMGRGDETLGATLMKAFVHTLTEISPMPDIIICYNTGVKLAVEGSQTVDDLKQLESKGVKILVCGTCANFFNVKEKITAGVISNMYDIASALLSAGRIVCP